MTNTSAVISILPQAPLNGVVKDYKIKYKSLETGETLEKTYPAYNHSLALSPVSDERTTDSCVDDGALIKQTDVSSMTYTLVNPYN